MRIAGAACMLAALSLSIWAVATFHRIGTTPNPAGGSTALAFEGPYRFSRNPMYLGLTLVQVGLALAADTLWPLLLLPVFVLIIRRAVIGPEERYLEGKFGEPYRAYKARVRRWI
jgi:protein-S-isoprenylcysteine O-methyltransferase Ste14